MKPKITYDEKALPFILEALDMKLEDGIVTAPSGQKERIEDILGFQNNRILTMSNILNEKFSKGI